MKFIIGYAGIPADVFDQVLRSSKSIVRENGQAIFRQLNQKLYDYQHAGFFLHEMNKLVREDHHNKLSDTCFAIICVDHPNTRSFVEAFFPSTLVIPVTWNQTYGSKVDRKISGNELIDILTLATINAKKALLAINKELRERANKTPLLLPIKNFKSTVLVDTIWKLQSELISSDDEVTVVRKYIDEFAKHHPSSNDDKGKLIFHLDDREIKFRAPGKATHGFARPDKEAHNLQCLLAGRRRLGAPFEPGFHFDCTKGDTDLSGDFFGCHTRTASKMVGDPHLNIAPNDFVRP